MVIGLDLVSFLMTMEHEYSHLNIIYILFGGEFIDALIKHDNSYALILGVEKKVSSFFKNFCTPLNRFWAISSLFETYP